MDAAIAERDGKLYLALNEEFHFAIYTRASAAILLGTIRDLRGRAGPYMTYLIDLASYMPHGNDLHRAILAALEARNGEEVRRQVVIEYHDSGGSDDAAGGEVGADCRVGRALASCAGQRMGIAAAVDSARIRSFPLSLISLLPLAGRRAIRKSGHRFSVRSRAKHEVSITLSGQIVSI
jgi:hypothetical protein